MTNKNLKEMFDNEFDIENMKKNVLFKKRKPKIVKRLLVVIFFCILTLSIVFINHKDNTTFTTSNSNNNTWININDLGDLNNSFNDTLNLEFKVVDNVYIPYIDILKNISIPKDFDNKDSCKAIYIKNNDKYMTSNIDLILNNYIFSYYNTKNNRSIDIAFSNEHEPIKEYHLEETTSEVSKIDEVEIKIYKLNNIYIAEFYYEKMNFYIKSTDLIQEEFINLLESIIK